MTLQKIFVLCTFLLMSCSVVHVKDRDSAEKKPKTKEALFNARAGEELRKRIVVLPFLNQSSYESPILLQDARDQFINDLRAMDGVILLEPKSLGLDPIESFREGSGYKIASIVKKIRSSGVHAIVIGTVKDLRTGKKGDTVGVFRRVQADVKATVELNVISVRSGQSMVAETRDADISEQYTRVAEKSFSDKDLRDNPDQVRWIVFLAFDKTIPILMEALKKFSWEGRVALVRAERVYLNAGRLSGLQIGDILRIVEPQEEVYDPENSQFIGQIRGRMKGTVEVVSYFGNDGAVTKIHSGSGFKENDLVEFY